MLSALAEEVDGDLQVALPAELGRFGAATTARITGKADGAPIVALGGISGNRFVCRGRDGGPGWWRDLVGPGCAVDPARRRVIGLDFAADPAGRRAPSTEDQARVLAAALDAAGIERVHGIVGASYGGMVALAFAAAFPSRVGRIAVISAGAEPHPAASAARELQRRIVALGLRTGHAEEALSIARGLAMLGYRTAEEFEERFRGGLDSEDPLAPSEPGGYLRARGDAFREVMSPERFLSLSASIDRHRVDPGRIGCPALLVGARSDQLVPPAQMRALAQGLAGPTVLHLLDCVQGHDMFLTKAAALGDLLHPFLEA